MLRYAIVFFVIAAPSPVALTGELPKQGILPTPSQVENDRFVADVKRFVADLEQLAGQEKALAGDGATFARSQLGRSLAQARRSLDDARVAARDRAESHVRSDPGTAIALAA